MTNLRRLLAYNLKENRKKLGLSQAKLAEKADLSTQYLAVIELERKFPSPEVLERLAYALELDTPELFSMPPSLEVNVKQIQRSILSDIEHKLGNAVISAVNNTLDGIIKGHLAKIRDD